MKNIKKDIIVDKNILYFDFTASGLAYRPIEEEILKILPTYANTHSEVSSNALQTSFYYQKARDDIKKYLELDDEFYILPAGTGATGAIKKFQEILGIYISPATRKRYKILADEVPVVIVGPYEHHSNEISYREGLCEVVRVCLDEFGGIDINDLEQKLHKFNNRELIVSLSLASNVTGVITDYKKIYELVKKYNAILALDGAAASPYMNVDCNYFDALFLSPHKLLGGVGSCGLLVIKKNLCKNTKPTFAGGGTVGYVSRVDHIFLDDYEVIEDAGTPGILQFIRASLAYKLRNEFGLENIEKIEKNLSEYFLDKLNKIKSLSLYSLCKDQYLPIFSFNIDNINPYDVAKKLSQNYGIQVRAGCSCAGPYGHDILGFKDGEIFSQKPGWVRVSIHFSHTKEDIDILVKAIEEISTQAN